MKRLLNFLRSLLVSPELLICVAGALALSLWPDQLLGLSERIGGQAEVLKYLGFLPAGLFVYDLKTARDVLTPASDKKAIFQKWARYIEFKSTCVVALIYGFAFGLGGIACLLFDWKTPTPLQADVLLTSIAGALATAGSLYFASIKIEELFRQNLTHSP